MVQVLHARGSGVSMRYLDGLEADAHRLALNAAAAERQGCKIANESWNAAEAVLRLGRALRREHAKRLRAEDRCDDLRYRVTVALEYAADGDRDSAFGVLEDLSSGLCERAT
jgi:hypothetical protein